MELVDLSGKVAIVTGGSGGIGAETCRLLADLGARVAIADIDRGGAEALVEEIAGKGGSCLAVETDVRDLASTQSMAAAVLERFEKIDILVNGAGWDRVGLFQDQDPELWANIIGINYSGVLNATKACLAPMLQARRGVIVSIASDNGRVGGMGEAVYSGAKAAVIGFSKALAREVARRNIRVNCVSPALTETAFMEDMKTHGGRIGQMLVDGAIAATPFKRAAKPIEVARAIVFLTSDAADFITGQVLSVNGGATMVD